MSYLIDAKEVRAMREDLSRLNSKIRILECERDRLIDKVVTLKLLPQARISLAEDQYIKEIDRLRMIVENQSIRLSRIVATARGET